MSYEGKDRRTQAQEDHDILVEHSVKLEQLHEVCKATNKKLDTFIEGQASRCQYRAQAGQDAHNIMNQNIDSKVSMKLFLWLMGLLIGALIVVTGLVGANSVAISQLHIHVEDANKHIDKNRQDIEELQLKIGRTGGP